ncbi:uncharacterized protein LOC135707412 [Ochlerotatus camptorhynchus]|uniref:uncharacterized protein LOC135707412 n=1 Tax=Ochlerotatus camptorhynchus TaxID=644619 RepID=UPI0031CF9091
MKGTNAGKTIEALEKLFNEHTYPETIRADNGPPFASEEFASYCISKNIRVVHSIPYWPQMNGLVERQNQGVLRALRIARVLKEDWRKSVQNYVYAYNTTPHSVTGKSPMELLNGRPVKDLLPSLRTEPYWQRDDETRDRDAIKKMQGKLYADKRRHARPAEIGVGDDVMLGKLEPCFRPEKYKVVQKNGSDVIVVSEDGVRYRRPVAHLRKWPTQQCEGADCNTSQGVELQQLPTTTDHTSQESNDMDVQDAESEEVPVAKRAKRSTKRPTRFGE